MTASSPWLDLSRRPRRRHLSALQRSEGAHDQTVSVIGVRAARLREVWADRVGVAGSALLPCASVSAALRLVAHACLLPDDTVRLARPGQLAWSAAALSAGAAYVDVGRLTSGEIDPATVTAAPAARLVILGAPAPTGADDPAAWPMTDGELRLADASRAASLHGYRCPAADLTLVVLRDPDEPASPLLAGLCGEPAAVAALHMLAGPGHLPDRLTCAALAALQRIDDAAEADFLSQLRARADRLAARIDLSAGQRWLPQAGVSRAVQCLAADGAAVAAAARALGYGADVWTAYPGGGLVRCALL